VQSIGLVLAFHNTQPPGTSGHDLRRAFERAYLPMLDALADFPAVRVSMHWSGPLLEWMELHAPDQLERLIGLVSAGQVELLGGLYGGGVVPALPERDIAGQVGAMTRWWRAHGDVRVRGAWLPYCAWDPSAARIFGRMGLQYTVLEDTQFSPPVLADGYYLTEREGTALALFAADTRLARMVPEAAPGRILKAVAMRARDGVRCVVLALPGEGFGAALDSSATHCFGGKRGWVRRFFSALTENAHWLKLVSFGTVLDRMRPTDRAYPPASVSLPVSIAALGGQRGAVYTELLEEARRGRDWSLERAAPFLRAASWDQLLALHPEINRLHKRMLRTSAEVARLRAVVREERREGDLRAEALEEATRALYRGQMGAAYVLGTDVGAQDPGVRATAYANLLRAEYTVYTALGEQDATRVEQADYDCDGRAEILVRTPHLCAIVAPSSGGSLVELDAWTLPGNLLNVRTRRDEPEHTEIRRAENLPRVVADAEPAALLEIVEEDDDEATEELSEIPELPSLRMAESGLSSRLQVDRHVRASFVDHFLGPEATLQNVRIGRFPEAGDFVGADYQLLHLEETDAGETLIGVARDGNVNEGAALRLVRVQKRFAFSRELPAIDVRYEIANRYHEPVRSRFAVELNLGLDGSHGGEIFLETAADMRVPLTEPGDHPDVSHIALVDEARGFRLILSFQQPARLWHYPIETVSRTPKGLASVFQGVCLLAWWPIELWGQERRRLDLSLSLEA
jgi:alpha-amylase